MLLTLVVIYTDEKILLGKKKRGFATGLWNGYGGKVNEGESIEEAALRELEEESGITGQSLTARGRIIFNFIADKEVLDVNIFSIKDYEGEVIETDEMEPRWFEHSNIPYDQMWEDDQHWLPLILQNKNVRGEVDFDSFKSAKIIKNNIEAYD